MNYKYLILWSFLCLPFLVQAQASKSDNSGVKPKDSILITGDADYSLAVSYFGNMTFHPGIRADVEKSWKVKQKTKLKTSKRRGEYLLSKSRELFPIAGAGFYVHPRQHTGTFVDAGLKFRKTRSKSFRKRMTRWNVGTGIGIYRSFLPETYEVVGDEVKKIPLAGRSHFYPYLNYGGETSWRKNPNHASFFMLNLMFLTAYNNTLVPLINIQFGYRFKLNKPAKKS